MLRVKPSSLAFLNAMAKSILKLFLPAPKLRCKTLSEVMSPWKASSNLTDGVVTMDSSMSDMENIFASIMEKLNSPMDTLTLMVSKGFGGFPKLDWLGFVK